MNFFDPLQMLTTVCVYYSRWRLLFCVYSFTLWNTTMFFWIIN